MLEPVFFDISFELDMYEQEAISQTRVDARKSGANIIDLKCIF